MMYVAVPGGTITKIELSHASAASFELNSAFSGTYANKTWTGALEEVALNYTSSNNSTLYSVKVTYDKEGGTTVTPDPTPDPDPEVDKAANIAEFMTIAPNKDDVAMLEGDVTVAYAIAKSGYTYIKDATASTLIFGYNLPYSAGDVIPGGWTGKVDIFNGLYEIKPEGDMPSSTGKVSVTYPEISEAPTVDMMNQIVVLKNVEFSDATPATKSNFDGKLGDATVQFRNNFTIASTAGGTYDVLAAISVYKEAVQVYPIEYTLVGQAKEVVATPEFSIPSGMVEEGAKVSITCATVGATIHYTVDGSVPTTDSDIYSSPLSITDDVTVRAIALKEGMNKSEVATATYSIKREGQQTATFNFNDITTLNPSFNPDEAPEKDNNNRYFNISGQVLMSNGVSFKAEPSDAADAGTPTRLYIRTSDMQLRIYKKNRMTLSVPEGYKLTKVVINYNNTGFIPLADDQTGSVADDKDNKTGTWTSGGADTRSVIFAIPSDGTNSQVNSIEVSYVDGQLGALPTIGDDCVAPVEYFNLQGVKVAGDNLMPGLYIMRQGSKVSKILVR